MTLIVSFLTPDYVLQVSDRCHSITRDGTTRFEEGHNKAVLFANSLAFSYTGAGKIEGRETDEWLQDTLASNVGEPQPLLALGAALERSLPPRAFHHAFVGVGWDRPPGRPPRPGLVAVSNFIAENGNQLATAEPKFSVRMLHIAPARSCVAKRLSRSLSGWADRAARPQPRTDEKSDPAENDPCWCGSGRKFKKCHGGG